MLRKAEQAGLLRARNAAAQANVRLDGVEREIDRLRSLLVHEELRATEYAEELRTVRDRASTRTWAF